jgi:hypothetical protein
MRACRYVFALFTACVLAGCGRIGFDPRGSGSGHFAYRKTITIDHTKVGTTAAMLVDYPLLFTVIDPDLRNLTSGGNVTDPGAADLAFATDDPASCAGTPPCPLDHEIERYVSSSGELVAWVRIPSLSASAASSDTQLYIEYGDPMIAGSTANPTGVWDASFAGVWHLNDDPTGASPKAHDSTKNGNDGTFEGGWTSASQVTGIAGGSLVFNGVDSHVAIPDQPSLDIGAGGELTVSLWMRSTQAPATNIYPELVNKDDGGVPPRSGFSLMLHAATTAAWFGEEYVTGQEHGCMAVDVADGVMHQLTLVRAASTLTQYTDGVSSNYCPSAPVGSLANPYPLQFGAQTGTEVYPYAGLEDEIRLSRVARSADWIAAEHANLASPSTFYSVGPQITQ